MQFRTGDSRRRKDVELQSGWTLFSFVKYERLRLFQITGTTWCMKSGQLKLFDMHGMFITNLHKVENNLTKFF